MKAVLTALLFLLPNLAIAAHPHEGLSSGEIYVTTIPVRGAYYPKVHMEAVVNAPPDKVWSVIEDCRNSQYVNERIMRSYVVQRIDGDVVCSELVHMPWPIRNLESITRWKFYRGTSTFRKTWTLVGGDFDYATGSWTLLPFGNGGRTHVIYENHVSPQISVPDWLIKAFLKVGLPGIIHDLRAASAK